MACDVRKRHRDPEEQDRIRRHDLADMAAIAVPQITDFFNRHGRIMLLGGAIEAGFFGPGLQLPGRIGIDDAEFLIRERLDLGWPARARARRAALSSGRP
jgi:hypothetical protein